MRPLVSLVLALLVCATTGTRTGPIHLARRSMAPRQLMDEATIRFQEQKQQSALGERLHAMVETQSKERALEQQKAALLERVTRTKTKAEAVAKDGVGEGEEPWYVKSLPWFMPPPPEWGPLPSTMYTQYYHVPTKMPLQQPNYYPLFHQTSHIEAPLGHAIGLYSKNFGMPYRGVEDLKPDHAPHPMPDHDNHYQKEQESSNPAEPSFVQLAQTEEPAQARSFGRAGPRTVAEHVVPRQEIPVPPHMLYGGQVNGYWPYQHYWHMYSMQAAHYAAHGTPFVYTYHSAPKYPPSAASMWRKVWSSGPLGRGVHDPNKPSRFDLAKLYYPSKYEQTTQLQDARLQQVGAEQDELIDEAREKALRDGDKLAELHWTMVQQRQDAQQVQ